MKITFGKVSLALSAATLYATTALAGDLVINFDDPNPAPKKGIEAAKQMAAHHLLSLVNSASVNAIPDESIIQIKDEQTIMQKYTIERQTDVASWFPAGDGMSYMQISPAPIEEPDRTP